MYLKNRFKAYLREKTSNDLHPTNTKTIFDPYSTQDVEYISAPENA